MKRVAVFCGSSSGHDETYARAARTMASALVKRRLSLVYGGGRVGLMGVIADAVLEAGGEVHGVLPQALATKELAHTGLTELYVVESMHMRKAKMAELADGFLAMPGGFGTLDETYEALTWAQLGFHQKPVALYNVAGYFDPLLAFSARAVADGFVVPEHARLLLSGSDAGALLDQMEAYEPLAVPKWGRLSRT